MTARRDARTEPLGPMVTISHIFDAPPAAVFKAWTEPEQVMHWWGPNGFTTPVCKIDLRPGGAWHYCMRSPEGRDYWSKGIYGEIIEPERIVSTDFFSDKDGNKIQPTYYGMGADWPAEMQVTVTFAAQDGKTKLTVQQSVPESLAKSAGAIEGWAQSLDRLAAHLTRTQSLCPMTAEPQKEHLWLQKFVGEWISDAEATMTPGQPPETFTGTESVRSIGGLWVQGEGRGEMPGGGTMTTILTFGYDPQKAKYVGTFIGSMMTHLWLYEGSLDAAGQILTLDTEGPHFATGQAVKFRDVVEFKSDDHRVMTSSMLDDNGRWQQFMTAHYRRKT